MRRNWILIPAVIALMGFAIGCGGSEQADTNETAAVTENAPEPATTGGKLKAPETEAVFASINTAGKLGCGHCTFEVKDECSLALKATDGEIYIVDAGDRQDELMAKRYDEPAVTIAGRVTEVDGQKVIYTDTVELN